MAPIVQHHHRPTTKVTHKPFKSRHASKGAIKAREKGKAEREKGVRRTPHQVVMSKLDRKNQARQRLLQKQQERAQTISIFSGQNGAPRQTAIVPLAESIDVAAVIRALNESVDVPSDVSGSISGDSMTRVRIDRFKQNLMFMPAKYELINALDVCRVADFVILVLPTSVEVEEEGENILRSIEGQGISNVLVMAQGLNQIEPPKKRPQVISSLKSFITHFFPTVERVLSVDSRQECSNAVRTLCTATPKGIHWRDDRSWMLIENVSWPDTADEVVDDVVVTGVVRGKGLKADRIVHIPGWGDFQVNSITAAPLPSGRGKKEDAMAVDDTDGPQVLDQPTADCDDMATVAPEEIDMEDDMPEPTERKGVLLDDHHYFSDNESEEEIPRAKRVPRGTSAYQSAWYLEDDSDSGSDMVDLQHDVEDVQMEDAEDGRPEDGVFPENNQDAMTEAGPSEYPQSEAFQDRSLEDADERAELEAYRASRRKEEKEDLEFPDEIELHPNVLARERLAKYRGLKSLRTSRWETSEDRPYEPEDWRRLLQFADYRATRNKVIREALVGGVNPGVRVSVHLRAVPASLRKAPSPVALFSLLRHEHKHSVVNINVTLSSSAERPIKSKDELIFQCGPRRLVVNPIFSAAGNTPNNVHKFDRFLHPGRSAIASYIGPVTWGAVPVLVFRRRNQKLDDDHEEENGADAMDSSEDNGEALDLVATGTVVAADPARVVAKRVILTGHPFKIHKRVVTVRYMFFNAEDVNWFKALPLWTKHGRSGYIKESLGTHGYFKATFDGRIHPQDTIGISLYKRVFPRKARPVEEVFNNNNNQ